MVIPMVGQLMTRLCNGVNLFRIFFHDLSRNKNVDRIS